METGKRSKAKEGSGLKKHEVGLLKSRELKFNTAEGDFLFSKNTLHLPFSWITNIHADRIRMSPGVFFCLFLFLHYILHSAVY